MTDQPSNEDSATSSSPPKAKQDGCIDPVTTCSICMEEWTIGSEHRVCALKCGHLFGRSCVERWLRERGASADCPNCSRLIKKSDLRNIWCMAVKAQDKTEVQRLTADIESERRMRKTDAAHIFQQNLRLEVLETDLKRLKQGIMERDRKIDKLQSIIERFSRQRSLNPGNENDDSLIDMDALTTNITSTCNDQEVIIEPQELKGMFHFVEKVESSSGGGCKSFALCPTSCLLIVAQPTPTANRNIFGAYGLRKFSTLDLNVREFIPLHSKLITSLQLKPVGDLILTSGQDKRVKITSINNNACIQTYECQYEPTCVAWSAHRDQQFYVASGNCFVTLFDIRNTSEYIYQTSQRVANTRLLSIAATGGAGNLNGLLVNDAKGSQFIEVSEESGYDLGNIDRSIEHMSSHSLPFEGLMGTTDFNKRLGLSLITTRRSSASPDCTHHLLKLNKVQRQDEGDEAEAESSSDGTRIECSRVRTFVGGRSGELLSQSRILRHPTLADSALVGACDSTARGIKLWDASDNTVFQTIRTDIFIRDMIMYTPENTNQHILYLLNDRGMNIYRWDYA